MARPRIHDDTVRQRLLEISSEVIAQHGADALSVRKVTAAAGTTTAAVYSLFGSREALIDSVITEGFDRFASHLDAVPHTADPAADMLALGKAYRANALQNPHFYRVMFSALHDTEGGDPGVKTFTILVEAVERAAQCNRSQAQTRAQRIWAYVHGLVSLELAGLLRDPTDSDSAERAYVASLRAATPLFLQ